MENKYYTFAEIEALLKTAIKLSGYTMKEISTLTGIKINTLYRWNCGQMHLSPKNADTLLAFFLKGNTKILDAADVINRG